MKKILISLLIFSIVFVQAFSYPAFASPIFSESQKSIKEAEEIALTNLLNNAPKEKRSRVQSIFNNPQTQLRDHFWEENTLHAIYTTEDPNILLTMSGETIQVLEKVNDDTFLVDGEVVIAKTSIELEEGDSLSKEPITPYAGWIEVPNPNVSWTYDKYEVENVHLNKSIISFTVATLAGILGLKASGSLGVAAGLWGIAFSAIEFVQNIFDENPSIVRIRRHIYKDTATNGFLYRQTRDYGDVKYKGSYHSVSNKPDYHYFSKNIGGP